ncbi:DUF4190 domain-containing protein [Frigoribacterium sp. PvP032]|uniref:DUF4190 domain-containing protein n=1 Tax=Frigoribacterium sp. PvP032 TaxID=2806589 RepID=UPI001AE64BD9|nr:DUF4190 domain-containing protein [Frigoribacterium sp. PvP032]MBP1189118.1 hypothetical protein [Frigoribacterium sp. PvP032]
MTDQPASRPPSPWARFARPVPGEQRGQAVVGPPPTLHQEARARHGAAAAPEAAWPPAPAPASSDEATLWAPQPTGSPDRASSSPAGAPGGQGSYFTSFDDDDFWDSRPPRDDDPGRGLAIASVVFGVFAAPLGLVFGLISARRSRRAGQAPTLALVGMVLSGVVIVASLIWGISAVDYATRLSSTCAQLGPGDYVDADGRTVTCG